MKEISQADLSTILKHISSLPQQSLLGKFCPTSSKSKSMFLCGTFWKKTFLMKQYILIKAKYFNALTKKGKLITVCLRATCKDRLDEFGKSEQGGVQSS